LKQVALLLSKRNQFSYATRPVASARHAARRRLLRLRRAFGCLGSSHGSSSTTSPTPCGLFRDSSSTTSSRAGSLSTISTTPRVRAPQHVARLVTRLIIDYFDYATRPGASARRAAHHATRRAACRRLLHLRRASGCLGMSRGSSHGSSSTTRVWSLRHAARLVA
jgi:hypothetical protein